MAWRGQRPKAAVDAGEVGEAGVEELLAAADRAAEADPGGPTARTAAFRAVAAAQAALTRRGTVADRRRLGRALWRDASAYAQGGYAAGAAGRAWHCWQVSLDAVQATRPHDPAFDDVVGELVSRAASVMPVLVGAGMSEQAAQMYQVCRQMLDRRPSRWHGRCRSSVGYT
jgi:hypothetical protein